MADAGGRRDLPTVEPFGDSAFLVRIGDRADPELTTRAWSIARAVEIAGSGRPDALGRPVVAHASVLVPFDPLTIDRDQAAALVREATVAGVDVRPIEVATPPPIEIAVRYGGPDGPDLDEVAAAHDLRATDVVELHTSATYRVLFLGFAPGFAYLGGLPSALVTPRRASPRERVPAGSVAIAGEQTGIYPLAMPGGWNLIGRTETVLFDPARIEPALLSPGAVVRFVPAR
jgi:KipI family sensor histidine kinase inhibitor